MQCKCIICGTMFNKSPSDNVLTCSPECSRRRRSEALTGHNVSDETRQKISSAARERGFTENLAKGNARCPEQPEGRAVRHKRVSQIMDADIAGRQAIHLHQPE